MTCRTEKLAIFYALVSQSEINVKQYSYHFIAEFRSILGPSLREIRQAGKKKKISLHPFLQAELFGGEHNILLSPVHSHDDDVIIG